MYAYDYRYVGSEGTNVYTDEKLGMEMDKVFKFIDTLPNLDLYVTVDRDVYIGSYTVYDDGNLSFEQVFKSLNTLFEKYQHSKKIRLCGFDITGLPQIEGRSGRNLFSKLLEKEQNDIKNRAIREINQLGELVNKYFNK